MPRTARRLAGDCASGCTSLSPSTYIPPDRHHQWANCWSRDAHQHLAALAHLLLHQHTQIVPSRLYLRARYSIAHSCRAPTPHRPRPRALRNVALALECPGDEISHPGKPTRRRSGGRPRRSSAPAAISVAHAIASIPSLPRSRPVRLAGPHALARIRMHAVGIDGEMRESLAA